MGKSAPSPPKPVDPTKVIDAEAEANRITEITPFGTRRFGEIGGGGEFVPGTGGAAALTTLPDDAQGAIDTGLATARRLAERAGQQVEFLPPGPADFSDFPQFAREIDFEGLPELPGTDDFSADARRVEDATFQRHLGLLNPEFARSSRALEQTLANRGLPIGSEAFNEASDRLDRAQNEARLAASRDSVTAGRAEQSRLFGLASSARGQGLAERLQDISVGQTARQQGISETFAQRGNIFNELASLIGTSQVATPNFAPPRPLDVTGAFALQQQGQQANFLAEQQRQADLLGGLFGLGSAGIGALGTYARPAAAAAAPTGIPVSMFPTMLL